ncbi:MAG: FG-GAP-like repeat-containing protein [Reichenbachiella sp.]
MKVSITLLLLSIVYLPVFGQTPYINSISPVSASVNDIVNITGSNLPTTNVEVFFGGVASGSVVATANLIKAIVPAGAGFGEVTVINTATGDIAYSSQRFSLSFDGASVTADDLTSKIGNQEQFPTSKLQTQDLCNCDFDMDGDSDVAISNVGSSDISIFTNTSTIGDANFVLSTITTGKNSTNVVCGDIDGDGLPDLLVNELQGEGKLFIFKNTSTTADLITFDTPISMSLPTNSDGDFRKPGRIAIQDLNLDGKPEAVCVVEDENIVYIFENNSTIDTLSLKPDPIALTAEENAGSSGLGGLDIADLNNDGLPEIVTSNLTEPGFYIFKNGSSPNAFSFNTPLAVATNSSVRTLKVGRINNDEFNDIVLTNSDVESPDLIEIIKNTTTAVGSDITVATTVLVQGIEKSWGLDLGDIDGDGDLDIAVASFGPDNNYFVVLNSNETDISSSDFEVVTINTTNNSRNIKLTDIDSDGKVDFVFTNNSTSGGTGFLSTMLNHNCINPLISPSGPISFCGTGGETLELIASGSGHTYEWKSGATILAETSNTLTLDGSNTSGNYTVKIMDTNGCEISSPAMEFTNLAETYAVPIISVDETAPCAGDLVTLSSSSDTETSSFLWEGPNGVIINNNTDENIVISDITGDHSGDYTLTTTSSGGCQKTSTPLTISVNVLPIVTITNPTPDYFCTGTTVTLSTTEFTGYTYEWKLNNASLDPIETNTSLDAGTAGSYTISISEGTCTFASEPRELSTIEAPTSSFTPSSTEICENIEITYTAGSTGADAIALYNVWDFKDGSTDEGDVVTHAHATSGVFSVAVEARYLDLEDCNYTPSAQDITIINAPTGLDLIISDNDDINNFEKCEESNLTLRVEDLYPSYAWYSIINNDTTQLSSTPSTSVGTPMTIGVALTDDNQCLFDANSVEVSNYTNGGIEITTSSPNSIETDPDRPELGNYINLIEEQRSVSLSVFNAVSNVAWSPTIVVDDTTAETIVATPYQTREPVYVSAIDNLGCEAQDSVTLVIPTITAAKSFTPNGDGINDCWTVSNIRSTDCSVTIFDRKGRRIQELDFSPDDSFDDCVWNGSQSNGNIMPSGTYYYVISCPDKNEESSGALFLMQ